MVQTNGQLFSLAGKYGSEIRPAFWINFLFLLMPVWGAVTLFTRPKDRPLIGGYNVRPTHGWLDLDVNVEWLKKWCLPNVFNLFNIHSRDSDHERWQCTEVRHLHLGLAVVSSWWDSNIWDELHFNLKEDHYSLSASGDLPNFSIFFQSFISFFYHILQWFNPS